MDVMHLLIATAHAHTPGRAQMFERLWFNRKSGADLCDTLIREGTFSFKKKEVFVWTTMWYF